MTLSNYQKDEILERASNKESYFKMAKAMGLKKDQVRDYCRTNSCKEKAIGMGIDLNAVKLKNNTYEEKHCVQCKKKYHMGDVDISSRKYCSNECKTKAVDIRKQMVIASKQITCPTCDILFISKNKKKYCSPACRRTTVSCRVCGNSFVTLHDSRKSICSEDCENTLKLSKHNSYADKFRIIHGSSLVPLDMYEHSNTDMNAWCVVCRKTTTRKTTSFLDSCRKRGCSHCGISTSTGEKVVGEWLDIHDISHIKQYSVSGLVDKGLLRYDFAITDTHDQVTMLIEYNGRQHYEPVEAFGGIKEFERQIRSDKMKNDYAIDNNIPIKYISYKNKSNLNNILDELFFKGAATLLV